MPPSCVGTISQVVTWRAREICPSFWANSPLSGLSTSWNFGSGNVSLRGSNHKMHIMQPVPLQHVTITDQVKQLFTGIENRYGFVPNTMHAMGHSPAVLNSYLSAIDHLAAGNIGYYLAELIALRTATINKSVYCDMAHRFVAAKLVGIPVAVISEARQGKSKDPHIQSLLNFVTKVVVNRGQIAPEEIERLKESGYTDTALVEVIAHITFNIFTNYFNVIVQPVLDFPVIQMPEEENELPESQKLTNSHVS